MVKASLHCFLPRRKNRFTIHQISLKIYTANIEMMNQHWGIFISQHEVTTGHLIHWNRPDDTFMEVSNVRARLSWPGSTPTPVLSNRKYLTIMYKRIDLERSGHDNRTRPIWQANYDPSGFMKFSTIHDTHCFCGHPVGKWHLLAVELQWAGD